MKKIRCRFGAVFLSSSEQKHRSVISIFTMFIYFNFLTKFSHSLHALCVVCSPGCLD